MVFLCASYDGEPVVVPDGKHAFYLCVISSWNHGFTRLFTLLARHALEKKVTSGIC